MEVAGVFLMVLQNLSSVSMCLFEALPGGGDGKTLQFSGFFAFIP